MAKNWKSEAKHLRDLLKVADRDLETERAQWVANSNAFVTLVKDLRENLAITQADAIEGAGYRSANLALQKIIDVSLKENTFDPTTTTVDDLVDLILWLSLSYGDNDPILPTENMYGQALAANVQLLATWENVVRSGRFRGDIAATILETEQATGDIPRPLNER